MYTYFVHIHLHTHTPIHCSECVTDVNVLVARKAIQAIGHIALCLPARANTCVEKLLSLLAMEIDYVTSETLVATTSEFMFLVLCICSTQFENLAISRCVAVSRSKLAY